jgi:hypothetical protein
MRVPGGSGSLGAAWGWGVSTACATCQALEVMLPSVMAAGPGPAANGGSSSSSKVLQR